MRYKFYDWEIEDNGEVSILAESPPPQRYNQAVEMPLFDDTQIKIIKWLNKTGILVLADMCSGIINPLTKESEGYFYRGLTYRWFMPILKILLKLSMKEGGEKHLERAKRYSGLHRENECGEKVEVTKENLYKY